MNSYQILDENGSFLFEICADSSDEALAEAKKANRYAFKAKFIENIFDQDY